MSAQSTLTLPPPNSGQPVDVLFIAGEHSGDQHAAKLVDQLRTLRPELRIAALGGPELKRAGAQLLYDLTASSVVGLVEVLKNLSFFRELFDATLSWIREYKPRAVCFVDYPGFNLRLAKELRKVGLSAKGGGSVKTLFYISPQIWAWKAGRRFAMARDLDAIAVIFPFEVACYADTDLSAEFVGHPFLADDYVSPVAYDPAGPILLLPGSRKQAVSRIFPLMLAGYRAFGASRQAVALYPSETIARVLRAANPDSRIALKKVSESHGAAGEPTRASAVLTSSGTMSMHCALAGIPGAIVYRASPLTYFFGRWLVKVPYLGIANLLLRAPMYPEYIQGAAKPAALAEELRRCIDDPARRQQTVAYAEKLHGILRQPTTGAAAEWVLKQLEKKC